MLGLRQNDRVRVPTTIRRKRIVHCCNKEMTKICGGVNRDVLATASYVGG